MAADRVVLLDENTANRIAAGEVIERPASAVKELVENAIDAGATQITVQLEEGGKRRLLVRDNGCGMTRSDAILALQRHATSKIRSADDLFAIQTLGFRGEALPSMASVSRLILTTKPADEESGTRIVVSGGDVVAVEEVAAQDGTTVDVADLFFNTPARLKFLKSTPTEVARILEVVGPLAVAYPDIALRVQNETQEIFSASGTGEMLGALAAVWGRDIARRLIPIRHEAAGLSVQGYVGTPDIARPGRSHELFFVNRRVVRSRLIGHALEEAFRALTPESRYPVAALFIEIAPDLVDVNVHPTKAEVKFTRDGEVHHAVSSAVKEALLAYGIVPQVRGQATQPVARSAVRGVVGLGGDRQRDFAAALAGFAPVEPMAGGGSSWSVDREPAAQDTPPTASGPQPFVPAVGETVEDTGTDPITDPRRPRPFAEQLRAFRVLGQARNTYIIALTPDGIAVVDQHVAHERVLYERLTVKRFSDGIPTQRLAVPVTLSLSRREALLLAEHCASFAEAGWEIEPFGGESFVLRAIPAMLSAKPYEAILRDMVDELANQSVARRLLVQRDHVTITNACKMAVKAGDPLEIPEMEGLLAQLAETENPYLCPHGRPIVVTISFGELDKLFKRT